MAKWFRISISLATKCRIGFSFAVLVVIAAGLFIPYRWMDKLVEQGKHELATQQVQAYYKRHFADPDPQPNPSRPALDGLSANSQDISAGDPLLARWIRIPYKPAAQELPLTQEPFKKMASEDPFLVQSIQTFLADPAKAEIFVLQSPADQTEASDTADHSDSQQGFFQGIRKFIPMNQPARYLYAVRPEASCLSGPCHAPRLTDSTPAPAMASPQPEPFSEDQLIGVISVLMPAGQTSLTLMFNRIFIIIGGLVSAVCAIVVFYLITQRFILQPVRSLREAAEDISLAYSTDADQVEPRQDAWQSALDKTTKIKTADEYEDLAQAFHQMLSRLKLTWDQLRQSNRALDLKLAELETKNIALFESNRLKSEFLANVSHELRTPLNAIIGFAEVLRERPILDQDEKAGRYVHNVLESGRRLLRMINDLLDLARIEAGKIHLHYEKCSIHSLIESLVDFARPLSQKKEITLNLNIADNLPLIETDPARLHQILFNLLDNAIKFTPEKGRIDLLAYLLERDDLSSPEPLSDQYEPDQPLVRMSIADTGPGIAPEDREKIFDKFLQLDGSVTRKYSGSGLGLAIVKELADVLHASITITDTIPQGSTFSITLPTTQPTHA